jgi:transposase
VRRLRQTGSVAPGKMGGHRPKAISGEHRVWLLQRIKRDFTLRGLVAELAQRGLKVDYRSVWEFVHAEKLLKKSVVAGERHRHDVARRRAQWIKYQDRVEPERLVFIDETWTRTDMAPLRGWAPRGCRLTATVPHGRWKTMTFLAALRHDRIEAPWFIEGPIDGDSFRLYVEKILLSTLRPGDIVVMDNLGSHRGKVVRQFIRSAGACANRFASRLRASPPPTEALFLQSLVDLMRYQNRDRRIQPQGIAARALEVTLLTGLRTGER